MSLSMYPGTVNNANVSSLNTLQCKVYNFSHFWPTHLSVYLSTTVSSASPTVLPNWCSRYYQLTQNVSSTFICIRKTTTQVPLYTTFVLSSQLSLSLSFFWQPTRTTSSINSFSIIWDNRREWTLVSKEYFKDKTCLCVLFIF